MNGPLLIVTVGVVGILHTLVPDHWAPLVVLGRQQGWSVARTARAASVAAFGHVTSTLVLGLILWGLGASLAARYGHAVDTVAAGALIAFGLWIAYQGWKETRDENGHTDDHLAHAHLHQHEGSTQHVHRHEHHDDDFHVVSGGVAVMHTHSHTASGRTALLLILGSSPMIEGIPAFLAASTYGLRLLATMALVFAAATTVTYVATCSIGIAGVQRISLGPLETYGEVLSGCFVAAVGVYALITG